MKIQFRTIEESLDSQEVKALKEFGGNFLEYVMNDVLTPEQQDLVIKKGKSIEIPLEYKDVTPEGQKKKIIITNLWDIFSKW